MKLPNKKIIRLSLVVGILIVVISSSFYLAEVVEQSNFAQSLIGEYGHFGLLLISIGFGLNPFVPIPPATFIPIFLAGGLSMFDLICVLAIGTLIADIIGFYLGRYSQTYIETTYPKTYTWMKSLHTSHERLFPFFIFLFAAFFPFPNEVFLLPAGVLGVKLRTLILPLILGAFVHQAIAAYGVGVIFQFFF